MIKALIFDWGDTVMRDFPECPGPMAEWEHVEWIPDLEDALKILNKKFTCCIASNAGFSDASLMKKAMERVGAEKYFHFFFTSKDLGYEKPDSRFFQKIAEEISFAPGECIMIGNVYKKDICGAKAVGMKTIFFNEKKLTDDFPDADKIIFSMKELIVAIDSLA
jgi:HAD superfamily hydrolase (TIGR01509 family)